MSKLDMACANLRLALSNNYAIERYEACKSPNYTHPGWVEAQKKQRGIQYGRLKNTSR